MTPGDQKSTPECSPLGQSDLRCLSAPDASVPFRALSLRLLRGDNRATKALVHLCVFTRPFEINAVIRESNIRQLGDFREGMMSSVPLSAVLTDSIRSENLSGGVALLSGWRRHRERGCCLLSGGACLQGRKPGHSSAAWGPVNTTLPLGGVTETLM